PLRGAAHLLDRRSFPTRRSSDLLVTTLKIWSDRKKKVQTPLIPSFVFVKTTPTELFNTLSIPGTASVLRYLGKPAIVRNEEIEKDRKSTRLNSSHVKISYAVFCL